MRARTTIAESGITIDGVETRALSVAGDGPPILLLHGFSDSADSWRPLLEQLASAGRHAVAIDLPGAGRAGALARRELLPALDRFVAAFVHEIGGGEPVVLVGNSLGGLLCMRAAQHGDVPLLSIAPVSPAGLAYFPRFESATDNIQRILPALRILYRLPVPRTVVRRGAQALYERRLAEGRAPRSLARYYASHLNGMADVRRLGAIHMRLAEESQLDPLVLDEIDVPVLLIWGGRDRLCDVRGAHVLLDEVEESRLVVLHDCGHCPQVQRPAEIAELLVELPDAVAAA